MLSGHCKSQPLLWMVCQLWLTCVTESDRNVKERGWQGKWWTWSRTLHLARIAIHLQSATRYSVTTSPLLLPTSFFHPWPTFIVIVGVTIQHKSAWETQRNWDRFSTLHRSLWKIVPFQCWSLILHIEFALFVQWGSLSPTSAQLVKAGGKEKRDLAFYFLWGGVQHEAHYVKLLFIDHDHGIWIQGTVHLVI